MDNCSSCGGKLDTAQSCPGCAQPAADDRPEEEAAPQAATPQAVEPAGPEAVTTPIEVVQPAEQPDALPEVHVHAEQPVAPQEPTRRVRFEVPAELQGPLAETAGPRPGGGLKRWQLVAGIGVVGLAVVGFGAVALSSSGSDGSATPAVAPSVQPTPTEQDTVVPSDPSPSSLPSVHPTSAAPKPHSSSTPPSSRPSGSPAPTHEPAVPVARPSSVASHPSSPEPTQPTQGPGRSPSPSCTPILLWCSG